MHKKPLKQFTPSETNMWLHVRGVDLSHTTHPLSDHTQSTLMWVTLKHVKIMRKGLQLFSWGCGLVNTRFTVSTPVHSYYMCPPLRYACWICKVGASPSVSVRKKGGTERALCLRSLRCLLIFWLHQLSAQPTEQTDPPLPHNQLKLQGQRRHSESQRTAGMSPNILIWEQNLSQKNYILSDWRMYSYLCSWKKAS